MIKGQEPWLPSWTERKRSQQLNDSKKPNQTIRNINLSQKQ